MPLYVYACPECELELEKRRPAWRADDPVECPACHGLCTREWSRFHAHIRDAGPSLVASPPPVGYVAFGSTCDCCQPRRRTR